MAICAGALASCNNVIREEAAGAAGNGAGSATAGGGHGGSSASGPQPCTAGFADCNGEPGDGCETGLDDDSAHCGWCAHDCLGAACHDGLCEPEVLATNLYYANRLAIDSERLYWTSADGTIKALPLAGGTPDQLAGGQNDPWDIAVDATGIYWTNGGSDTVQALPFAAQLPLLLAEAGNPYGITVRNGFVYYTDTYDKLSNDEHVVRVPGSGGAKQTVGSTAGAWLLAVDDHRVYWTDPASDAVWSAPVEGGSATLMASILEPSDIEVDGEAVYVTGLEGTFRLPLAGGAPETLIAGAGLGLALDATDVFVGAADGRLLRVPRAGGAAVGLAKADLYPTDIAVDEHYVYWIVRAESGVLLRTPR